MAPSADIGDQYAVFQPSHGTAPDIAGKGIANPSAMFLSVAMMLEWLSLRHQDPVLLKGARMIEQALEKAFREGDVLPYDFGGRSDTEAVALAVIARL
jgi:3-isopropylmalate dehydrogenase